MSVESVTANLRTLELLVGLIHSCTKASKGPTCPDIENKDLSSTSSTCRADFNNPESQTLRTLKWTAIRLHSRCLDMYPIDLLIQSWLQQNLSLGFGEFTANVFRAGK